MKKSPIKTAKFHSLFLLALTSCITYAQQVQTLDPPAPSTNPPQPMIPTQAPKNQQKPQKTQKTQNPKKNQRNPFAAGNGVTAQSTRVVREALNVTKILGVIHTADGKKMAVLKINSSPNPLFVRVGSTFSIKVRGRDWRDVEVIDITQFEVKVTPKGTDGKIIIR